MDRRTLEIVSVDLLTQVTRWRVDADKRVRESRGPLARWRAVRHQQEVERWAALVGRYAQELPGRATAPTAPRPGLLSRLLGASGS